jgi:hypothetical protein
MLTAEKYLRENQHPYEIIITDLSDYDPLYCNNGGKYSFWTIYTRVDNNNYSVTYGTSADFPFCPLCGSFYTNHCACGMDSPINVGFQHVKNAVVSARKLIRYEIKIRNKNKEIVAGTFNY